MSFIDCINSNAVLSQSKKDSIIKEYEKVLADNVALHGDVNGALTATVNYMNLVVEKATQKKLNMAKHVLAREQQLQKQAAFVSDYAARKKKAGKAFQFLYRKSDVSAYVYDELEKIGSEIGGRYSLYGTMIGNIINRYSSKIGGFKQDIKGFRDVVAETRGKDTGNAEAKAMAKELQKVFEIIHEQYRQVGGIIGKLPNYFPQRDIPDAVHNLIKKHGGDKEKAFAEYLADKMLYVDRKRMVNPRTGFTLNDEEFAAQTREIFDEIVNFGLDTAPLVTSRKMTTEGGMLAERKSASRFFHYKDADAFFANNNKYGGGDEYLFDNMMDYLQAMARDISVMSNLGPHADLQMFQLINDAVADGTGGVSRTALQGVYDTVAGRNAYGGRVNSTTVAIENIQNVLRASQLGGAVVPAVSDSFWVAATARYNGLDATGAFKNWLGLLNPLDKTDRMFAANNILISESANANSLAMAHAGDAMGTGATRFMANAVIRLTGLGQLTQASRVAVSQSLQGFLAGAKSAGFAFDEMPDQIRAAFTRWGMNEADFKNIMKAAPSSPREDGSQFITAKDVWEIDRDTATKYAAWLYDISQMSSNEPRMLTRAITSGAAMSGNAQRGSIARNAASTVMMYKAYGISVMLNHIIPALQHGAETGRWGRIATISAVMPLLSAATIQAREVLYGRTPQDMDTAGFWVKAFANSGVFGPISDRVLTDANKYDYGVLDTMVGPIYDLADNTVKLTIGNVIKAYDPKQDAAFGRDVARMMQQYTPKLWYTKVLQERLIYDQLNRMADPTYDSRMRKLEKRMMEDKGQNFIGSPYR